MSLRNVCLGRTDLFALLAMDCQKSLFSAFRHVTIATEPLQFSQPDRRSRPRPIPSTRLFESRLALTWDENLTKVPVSLILNKFSQQIPSDHLETNQN